MNLLQMARRFLQKRFTRRKIREVLLGGLPNVVHVGSRALCKRVLIRGIPHAKKTFTSNTVGLACFEREMAAQELFQGRPWLVPVVKSGRCWLIMPWYPQETRLDQVCVSLKETDRLRIAKQAVEILFDIFLQGYAHRDFHAGNLFLVEDQLIVTDFEVLGSHPPGGRPAFPVSYDIGGEGLESPFETKRMCYTADDGCKSSLNNVLGIPIDDVLEEMKKDLKEELRVASGTFRTQRNRHKCRAERIYGSFDLPYFRVAKEEAQRDCTRRLENFRVAPESLREKTILDLGSNVGGMLFEIQKLNPGRCVGVEYDKDKVQLATKIAAYCGLNNVSFFHADIDKLKIKAVEGPFDVVFCLAVEAHVKSTRHLYALLSFATRETLYFEGNATTDPAEVESQLRKNGFVHVECVGLSDDDCVAENNCRPLLIARK